MSLSLATASRLAYSSGLSQRTTGSTTDWKTIHGFCNGLLECGTSEVRSHDQSQRPLSECRGQEIGYGVLLQQAHIYGEKKSRLCVQARRRSPGLGWCTTRIKAAVSCHGTPGFRLRARISSRIP